MKDIARCLISGRHLHCVFFTCFLILAGKPACPSPEMLNLRYGFSSEAGNGIFDTLEIYDEPSGFHLSLNIQHIMGSYLPADKMKDIRCTHISDTNSSCNCYRHFPKDQKVLNPIKKDDRGAYSFSVLTTGGEKNVTLTIGEWFVYKLFISAMDGTQRCGFDGRCSQGGVSFQ